MWGHWSSKRTHWGSKELTGSNQKLLGLTVAQTFSKNEPSKIFGAQWGTPGLIEAQNSTLRVTKNGLIKKVISVQKKRCCTPFVTANWKCSQNWWKPIINF